MGFWAAESADEFLQSDLWRVTARPPSRYEEDSLLLEGLNNVQVDVKLVPRRHSFVQHLVEKRRVATFGVLIDHGSVSIFMQSKSGRWSSTGIIARSPSALVPFVSHPIQEAILLDLV